MKIIFSSYFFIVSVCGINGNDILTSAVIMILPERKTECRREILIGKIDDSNILADKAQNCMESNSCERIQTVTQCAWRDYVNPISYFPLRMFNFY